MSEISSVAIVLPNELFTELLTKLDEYDTNLCNENSHEQNGQTLIYFEDVKWYDDMALVKQVADIVDNNLDKCKFIEIWSGQIYQEKGSVDDNFDLGYSMSITFNTKE